MSDVLLELTDLCVRTPHRALVDGVSVSVKKGEVTAVVGASGSGKSLSARAMMGVIDVDPGLSRGSLRYPAISDRDFFDGVRGKGPEAQQKLLLETMQFRGGYVTYSPQSAASALNPGRTIGRQMEMAVERRSDFSGGAGDAIVSVLEEVGLNSKVALALPGELSGGMAQRAALAIAIAPNPKVLIADEPETGLDPVLRRVVTELMIEVAAKRGVGLVLISHNMDTVSRVAQNVVVIGQVDPRAHEGGEDPS